MHASFTSEDSGLVEQSVFNLTSTLRGSVKAGAPASPKVSFTCSKCKISFPDRKRLINHVRSMHQEKETRQLRSSTSPKGQTRQLRSGSSPTGYRPQLRSGTSPVGKMLQFKSSTSPVRKRGRPPKREENQDDTVEHGKVKENVTLEESKDTIKVVKPNYATAKTS